MSDLFKRFTSFNADISNWDVSNVINMNAMFNRAISFNQDISKWKVDNVTNMESMFRVANSFNQDISQWNVSKVKKMGFMFSKSKSFNQDISKWDVKPDTIVKGMFNFTPLADSVFNKDSPTEDEIMKYFTAPVVSEVPDFPDFTETPSPIVDDSVKFKFPPEVKSKNNAFSKLTMDNFKIGQKPFFTIYAPDGKVYGHNGKTPNNITQELVDTIKQNDSIIIGNGGAGAIGFIKYLAEWWNKNNIYKPMYVIWRASHTFQNFEDMETIDAAITYEPHLEIYHKNKNIIEEPSHLFFNQLELVKAESDPFFIEKYSKERNLFNLKILMYELIFTAFVVDVLDSLPYPDLIGDNESRFNIYFMSRYNHSAMGETDHFLFFHTIEFIIDTFKNPDAFEAEFIRIVLKLKKNITADKDYFGLYNFLQSTKLKEILDSDKHELFGKHYKLDDLNTKEIEIVLYKEWMNHVERLPVEFPWDIIKMLKEDTQTSLNKYRLAYHVNDVGFLYRDGYSKYILSKTTSYEDFSQNPAQLWLVKRDRELSIEHFDYTISQDINEIINGWYPSKEIEDEMNKDLRNFSKTKQTGYGLFLNYPITYKTIFKSYMKRIKLIESNDYINKTWFWHNPPQSKVTEYLPLANYYD